MTLEEFFPPPTPSLVQWLSAIETPRKRSWSEEPETPSPSGPRATGISWKIRRRCRLAGRERQRRELPLQDTSGHCLGVTMRGNTDVGPAVSKFSRRRRANHFEHMADMPTGFNHTPKLGKFQQRHGVRPSPNPHQPLVLRQQSSSPPQAPHYLLQHSSDPLAKPHVCQFRCSQD